MPKMLTCRTNRFTYKSIAAAISFALLGVAAIPAMAQSSTQGAISGTIFDATGAVVANAKVTIHSNATNGEVVETTDASGAYADPLVEPGTYTVSVAASGFEAYKSTNVIVQVSQVTAFSPHITAGATTATVEVVSEAPVLNFEAPDFATNLNQTAIQNIPINNRRWSALALTAPGVSPDTSGFGLISVRGISTLLNNVEIDGADDNQAYYSEERGRTRAGYSTAGSAVREFQVNTGVYSAEFGRAAGGVINSVTKSGTNSLHGQIYGFDRQSSWGAHNDYTTQTVLVNGVTSKIYLKPKNLRKIYGFTAGGPLIKDKLFWNYTYDQHTNIFPAIATPSTPSAFYLTADTTLPVGGTCSTTNGQTAGTSGANAATDQEVCLMAARLAAAGYGAFAGTGGYTAAANLFNTDLANLNSQDLGSIPRAGYQEINTPKLDWNANAKEHVSLLYHRLRWDAPGDVQTQNPVFYGVDTTGTDFVKLDYGVAKLTSLVTSSISNEVLYQYGRELNDEGQTPYSAYTTANLIGPTGNVPEVVFSSSTAGGLTFGSPYYSYRKALPDERKWQVEDTLYWSKGNHTVKLGTDLLHNYDLINNTFESNGVYTYAYESNYFTDLYLAKNGYAGPNAGFCNAAASQVYTTASPGNTPVGTAPCFTSYVQGYGNPVYDMATFDWAGFVQDNWKFSPRLTLELGLRYDQEMLPTQKAAYVNPNEIVNGVAVGNNHPSDKNNFGPRIGFSWDPYGAGKTVVRGGYGMYYGRLTNGVILNALLNTGFGPAQYTTSFNSTATTSVPAGKPFNSLDPAPPTGPVSPSVEYLDSHLQNPMVEEFDLAVQQELGKATVLSVSYLGALGKELTNFLDYNLNPATETVNVTVAPATGTTNYGPLGPGTIPVQVFTSYKTTGTSFGAITDVLSNINSNYNALVAEIQNHSLHAVQFDLNYVWAHELDYNQNTTTTTSTTNWLNPYASPRSNYGNGSYNVPNTLKGYVVYRFPNLLNKSNWASYATNGWSIDDSFNAGSGLPYSITVSGNVASNKVLSGWNGGGDTQYIPNIGRNTAKYPRHVVDDLRVEKAIDFTERYNLHLFVNVFNVANHQNIDGLNVNGYAFTGGTTSAVTATYQSTLGSVTSSNSSGFLFTPRQLEIAARFSF